MSPFVSAVRQLVVLCSLGMLLIATPLSAQTDRKITRLAEGVYTIEHQPSGNTTVIIGDRQVFVVDTGFLPSAARDDIAQIRRWTDKPVVFALNTHFHNDHNIGNRAYMDAFPAITIIAHTETKKEMDMFGPGSLSREENTLSSYQDMLKLGKTSDGQVLTSADKAKVRNTLLPRELNYVREMQNLHFQSATLTFDHDFTIDLGNREVQVKFLGRGNTGGDAVVYLPKEKIVVAGDIVVYPIPDIYDGYPREWIDTLQNLAALDANTIVPGHGPVLHDKAYLFLLRDLLKSTVTQMDALLVRNGPAMFQSLDSVKAGVNLSPFRSRFVGPGRGSDANFDNMTDNLVRVAFYEASLH